MLLTHKELADIDKLLGRMEKNARVWRFARWILIAAALFSLGMAVWAFTIAQSCCNTPTLAEPSENVIGA